MNISRKTRETAAKLLRENLWRRYNRHDKGVERFLADLQAEVRTLAGAVLAGHDEAEEEE